VIVAIMQPYFFPYIGYFQLMKAVDVFVIYDDAQYMKGGWINRNRIRTNAMLAWLTFPVRRASISLRINQRHYLLGAEVVRAKQRLQANYAKAPAYTEVASTIFSLMNFADDNVARYNANLLTKLATSLEIQCTFMTSSTITQSHDLKGQDKVIDLCKRVGADHYINAIGGMDLYDPVHFTKAGLTLSFLRTAVEPAQLASGTMQLSIIDTLMFNGIEGTNELLKAYSIGPGDKLEIDREA